MSLVSSILLLAAVQQVQATPPARVEVIPSEVEIQVGASHTFEVRAYDADGALLTDPAVGWGFAPAAANFVELVSPGVVRAIRPGSTQIAAIVEGVIGIATVTIPQLPVSELDAEVPESAIPAGASAPLQVTGRTRLGDVIEMPPLEFRSLNPEVAGVDPGGRVYGRQVGTARIEIVSGEARTEVEIAVGTPLEGDPTLMPERSTVRTGDVVRLQVESPDGTRLHPEWSVNTVGATVEDEDGEGVFVAEDPGMYRVTAMIGEETVRTAFVTVEERGLEAELISVGRGPISEHHSGDMWVFEGVDGRDYVYIGTYEYDWMKVWDVTDMANPVLTDSVQMDARRINDVKINAENTVAVVTREGASSRRNGIVLLDLTTPSHPTVLSEYTETVTGGVHNVWIEGDIVYAAHNGTSDIHILDISNPQQVSEVGRWGLDKTGKTLHDVIIQDGYAYLSYWDDGIVMLDVGAGSHGGTPTEPAFVSDYAYPIGSTHVAWRSGRYLFVGDELFPPGWDPDRPIEARGYIHVLDYDDPENPVEVARYEVPEAGTHNVWVDGDRLYVGYYQAGLRVLDISGELRGDLYEQGREIAVIKTVDENSLVANWPMTWGAQVYKGHIFSTDFNSGLWITKLEERSRVVF